MLSAAIYVMVEKTRHGHLFTGGKWKPREVPDCAKAAGLCSGLGPCWLWSESSGQGLLHPPLSSSLSFQRRALRAGKMRTRSLWAKAAEREGEGESWVRCQQLAGPLSAGQLILPRMSPPRQRLPGALVSENNNEASSRRIKGQRNLQMKGTLTLFPRA